MKTDANHITFETISPSGMADPSGFSYAIAAAGTRTVYISGQISQDGTGAIVAPGDIVGQFKQTLSNFVEVLGAAGAVPEQVVKMNVYVTDVAKYRESLKPIGVVYREVFGRHYPAITLVEVSGLFQEGSMIEIEGVAVTL